MKLLRVHDILRSRKLNRRQNQQAIFKSVKQREYRENAPAHWTDRQATTGNTGHMSENNIRNHYHDRKIET